ncbi:hypothetical protein [Actinomadura sp. 9N407]|uniref:hypothetical protein n=1 Tax=Actinomadura sp. 9N407 TaxID=3375154 RepID=UPI0037AADDA2
MNHDDTRSEHADVRGSWLVEILNTALDDLSHAERVITAFADQTPDGFIAWGMAEGEATQARQALLQAPSLRSPAASPVTDATATTDALYELASKTSRDLVRAAELAGDPADKMACLQAALHAGRLRDNLR